MSLSDYLNKYLTKIPSTVRSLKPAPRKSSALKPAPYTLAGLIRNTITGLPRGFSEVVGQPSMRVYAGVGSALSKVPGPFNAISSLITGQRGGVELTPSSYFQKELYGADKKVTSRTAGEEILGEGSKAAPALGFALGAADLFPGGKAVRPAVKGAVKVAKETPKVFKGFTDLSTKLLEKLKGRTTVSRQFIEDLTNSADLKQGERDLIRNTLKGEADTVSVPDFANKVKSELLPLKASPSEGVRGMEPTAEARGSRYENITLPDELRGPVANYNERIYTSPIKTSAGDVHFSGEPNYFAHTRVEDLANDASNMQRTGLAPDGHSRYRPQGSAPNTTRRVIELQSDLFQKGRLENETTLTDYQQRNMPMSEKYDYTENILPKRKTELSKLEPYRNTWHERLIREEVKQAAKDGKTKLQFPTGETAMKIEGLGERNPWYRMDIPREEALRLRTGAPTLTPQTIRVGQMIGRENETWIITKDLGGGRFKAAQKNQLDKLKADAERNKYVKSHLEEEIEKISELSDISGNVDTNNPIYRFYEKEVGRYLINKFGAKRTTDPQGVAWYEVDIKKDMKNLPIEAFGGVAGVQQDEEGNMTFDPKSAALGFLGVSGARSKAGREIIDKVERGFIQSVKELLPQVNKIAGQYIPRATDALAIKAKNLIKDSPDIAEKIAMTRSDDSAVAIASELLKKYADEALKATGTAKAALYDKAAEIANTLAPKLTEQGRSIQAASILGRLTPEGQIRFAAREIQRFNELNPTKKIPELTGEQAKYISDEMRAIQKMADGEERAIRFKNLQDHIKDLVPTPLIQKVVAIWKAGLLTGLKTTGLNVFSNLSHAVTEIAKDVPASVVDSVAALFTGKRAKTLTTKGFTQGFKEGMSKGVRYFKTGYDVRDIASKLDYKRVNFGKGKVAKAFQAYTDTVFRVLGATDQPFYYGALTRSLFDQALAGGKNAGKSGVALTRYANELVGSPTTEMMQAATVDALQAVFQNKTALGTAARAIQKIPVVGEFVLPFARTPSSVATQIINYSPVGLAKPVLRIIEGIRKGNFDQRLFSQEVGRALTGTGVMIVGLELAKKGLIALDRPTTEKEQKLWELEGRKPNSIKIGGKWRSPMVLGPAGNVLLIGAHLQEALKTSKTPTEALSKAILGSLKSFSEQTFLTGINQLTTALSDPERSAESYLSGLIASAIPTLVADFARATDPNERRAETISQRVQSRVPGLRTQLPPQVDVLGQERESVGNPLEIMLDPTRPSPERVTPVITELRRLFDAGQESSPTLLGDKKGFPVLSQEENTELWKRAGEIIDGKLGNLFSKEAYLKLSDEEKGKTVNSFVEKSKVIARAEMVIKLTEGLTGDALKQKLSELKTGGLMTREVYSKYLELR